MPHFAVRYALLILALADCLVAAEVPSKLVRKGVRPDPSNLLIGEWNGTRDFDGHEVEMRWLFYPTGKSLLLIPFYTDHGQFAVEGAQIRVAPREAGRRAFRYRW